jgi:hypothetical protein
MEKGRTHTAYDLIIPDCLGDCKGALACVYV